MAQKEKRNDLLPRNSQRRNAIGTGEREAWLSQRDHAGRPRRALRPSLRASRDRGPPTRPAQRRDRHATAYASGPVTRGTGPPAGRPAIDTRLMQ
mmetsp:Transcript_39882/g.68440  ORF Transcript_39882/g.68440 Transcript_39882/m.68440 type:complete len:95 (+) Transcript_39882:219-503(+)